MCGGPAANENFVVCQFSLTVDAGNSRTSPLIINLENTAEGQCSKPKQMTYGK